MANKDRPSKNLPKRKDSEIAERRAKKKEERREKKKALKDLKRKSHRTGNIPTKTSDD